MKKFLSVLLVLVMLFSHSAGCYASEDEPEEYTSGDFKYTLDDLGNACITGWNGTKDTVSIPSSIDGHTVTALGDYAFAGCTILLSIIIPDSVTSIGINPFDSCPAMITVSDGNPYYAAMNGILYNKSTKELISYSCRYNLNTYAIPNWIRSIGTAAFSNCKFLKILTIPDSVLSIGDYAFRGCDYLTYITFPDSLTCIGDYAFYTCKALKYVTLPDSVLSIGTGAFQNCYSLTSINIPDSVTFIGGSAFENTKISSITIPEHLTSIEPRTFYSSNLTGITFSDSVTSIGELAFGDNFWLKTVMLPVSLESIGKEAFSNCRGLTSVTIPDSVTFIDTGAFSGDYNLTITATGDSFATAYAEENSIPYMDANSANGDGSE